MRGRCSNYLTKFWRYYRASIDLRIKEKLELSADTLAFISCKIELRVKLVMLLDRVVWIGEIGAEREGSLRQVLADVYAGRFCR